MRPISKKTKEVLENSQFMKSCCLSDDTCLGRIEWHHNLIVGGRQSDIPETILPLCVKHHQTADHKSVKERLNWIMLNRMSNILKEAISKAVNYKELNQRLDKKYGKYNK